MTPLSLNKILILLLILSSSCSESKSDQANKNFAKKYGLEVESINARRIKEAEKKLAEEQSKNKLAVSSQIKEDFLPSPEVLRRLSSLPNDMFVIRYYSYNFPDSYGRPRLSFDDIQIPTQDAFGVATDLGEKNYQLVDGKALQEDVDFVRDQKEQYDDEVSLQLIREEKEKKRREYLAQKLKEKESQEQESAKVENAEIENTKIEKEEEKNDENQTENTNKAAG